MDAITGEVHAQRRAVTLGRLALLLMGGLAFILAADHLHAQARAPAAKKNAAPKATPAPDMAKVRNWLESLHGEYVIEVLPAASLGPREQCVSSAVPGGPCTGYDVVRTPAILVGPRLEGKAECRPVGAGPGTRCVFQSNASNAGMPAVILFGLQADYPGIRVLSVDVLGRTQGSEASLSRYGIKLDTPCPINNCARLLEFEERKNGRVEITFMPGRGPEEIGGGLLPNKRIVMQRLTPASAPAGAPSR
jgi:hypothetical protein